jgi:molybdopterin-binding protein
MQQSDQTIYSGKSTSVRYTYPFNYTIGTPASMAASFIISPVITEEYLVNNTSKTKKENLYTYNSNGFYVPQQQKITDITSNTYKTFEFYDYNNKGHILSQGQTLNTKTSYIYDYLNELPIAEVVNADNASIAFTSFEADGKGNWSFTGTPAADANALTGGKTYALSLSSLSKSGLNTATTYTVSYWSKGAAGSITGTLTGWPKIVNTATVNGQAWTCYEHLVTGQSTITLAGSNIIDEVSLHPRMTLMTTYTYRPLTGISSSSNSNYRITYYDYDGMGRLEYVRDDKGAILKKIGYNYAGPIDNTQVFYNGAQSQSFARNDCTGGMVGSSVTYKVAAGAYISSISQAYVDSLALAEIATNGPAYALVNSTCIVPCDTRGCRLLEGSKCVNNICEAGQKIYTSSVFDQMTGKFTCTYHYKWSDNSVSADYTEQNSFGCPGF